jgi:hypothetical protein
VQFGTTVQISLVADSSLFAILDLDTQQTTKGEPVSAAPSSTRFISRGRLNGVVRQRPVGGGPTEGGNTQPGREQNGLDELDTQTFEALYYRARLILGEPLPRPGRFQLRGH